MNNEKSKTPVGKELEYDITFAVRELKAVSDRLAFIRHGLKDPDDIEGAMGVLHLVEEHLDDLILDIKDNIEKVIALDAIATGQGLFVPRKRYEQEAIDALNRAQAAEPDFHFATLPLTEVMCRAVVIAEKAFKERCKSILVSDDDVAAVVEAVSADQTPEGANHAK